MKKILIIITTSFVSYGGLTTVMMNYYRAMDKTGLKIDFASINKLENKLADELRVHSSNYYNLGNRKKAPFLYFKRLIKVLKSGQYDIIHVNGNSSTIAMELMLAKCYGVKQRIAHGHASTSNYPMIHKILMPLFKQSYTHAIAVSKKSGDWLFKDNYIILNNAIDTKRYSYNGDIRDTIREQYNLKHSFVVGNVGKLNPHKNHAFLFRVFKEIKKEKRNAVLLLAGGGELENNLRGIAEDLGITESVVFLGMIENVSDVLQAMDVFVFPSKFEGLGMALIEAQASGLECFASDSVPFETKVSDYVRYLSLSASYKEWANMIVNIELNNREEKSLRAGISIANVSYDINREASKLKKIYLSTSF